MSPEISASRSSQSIVIPMLIIGTLFFVFGFVTWLNGSLIPFLKIVCELNEFQALLVAAAFYIAYTVFALPAAAVLRRVGYKRGMVGGLGVMAVGALLFIPAAQTTYYGLFLFALFVLGGGLTLLQTASNPYIVCIGPRESAAMRISIMGLVNKGAGVVVPLLFTALILTGMDQFSDEVLSALEPAARNERLAELSARLVYPYVLMAIVLIGLMVFVYCSPLSEPVLDDEPGEGQDADLDKFGVLRFPQLILGALALFTYVGVEVIAGDTIGLYGQSLGLAHFGSLTSYTMAFMVLGYILGVLAIPKYLSQSNALLLSALLGMVFTAGIALSSTSDIGISEALFGWMGIAVVPDSVMFLALLGFANALVWPAIWPLALEGLGKYTSTGAALLIMGIAGGALLPLVYGHLAHSGGDSQSAYWMMLPCYAFILFYAIKGHKLRRWK
ncbi:sugar MFS transporter [Cellvibrio japonicus]|uniref:Glucose/galactose transporter n=1 Tax=Cellvibrio japonicus (strain Ueda107) TaxID=498211 RepID=B3PBU7_CELJU|nr:sugar MFS transporter [Cellvibrio japonicus]ACE82812.1 glucose/galactose transporter [Cellvibrio japonicus Ueda107]QEI14096.1 sugar MFS transporter [Cellvibrio japonicus]QEI17671.1 sugar MFS transporter [Cellvibrio japonicus]QEI21245.1 sugar MFS transporter [Cellvibrio japonicus]